MPTHSSPARPDIWAGPLPPALALMAPFDLLASLAMDVPARGAGHARGLADHARHGPADPQRLHAGAGTGPMIFGPLSDRIGRRPVLLGGAAVCRRVAGAGRRRQRRALRRVAAATGAGRLGRAGGHVRHRARCLCRPAGRQHHLWPVQRHAGLRPRARADARRGHRGGLRLAGDLRRAGRGGPAGVVARHAALARDPSIHAGRAAAGFAPMLGSLRFWIYTLGFSAAMGAFFVFFSTSPRVLMGAAGYSHGLQRGLLDGRAGHDRGHAAGARLVARWASPAASRAGRRRCWRARRSWPAARTTAPSLPPS